MSQVWGLRGSCNPVAVGKSGLYECRPLFCVLFLRSVVRKFVCPGPLGSADMWLAPCGLERDHTDIHTWRLWVRRWLAVSRLHALLPLFPNQTSASPPNTLWVLFGAHRLQACPSFKSTTSDSQRTFLLFAALSCWWHGGWDTETEKELTHPSNHARGSVLLTPVFLGLPRCQGVVGIRHLRIHFHHYWLPLLCFFLYSATLKEVAFHWLPFSLKCFLGHIYFNKPHGLAFIFSLYPGVRNSKI